MFVLIPCTSRIPSSNKISNNLGEMYPLSAKTFPYLWISVVYICSCKTECYDFSSAITQQVKLESVTPAHCAFAIGSHPFEYLAGITSWIVTYRYHGAVNKTYTRASPKRKKFEEENRFEEYALFQFYKSVI